MYYVSVMPNFYCIKESHLTAHGGKFYITTPSFYFHLTGVIDDGGTVVSVHDIPQGRHAPGLGIFPRRGLPRNPELDAAVEHHHECSRVCACKCGESTLKVKCFVLRTDNIECQGDNVYSGCSVTISFQ